MPSVLYSAAAEALRRLEKRQGSLKSIVFSRADANSKKVYALACQTLKHKGTITEAIERCKLLQSEPKLSLHLAMVLVYDLLYGKGIQCGGPLKRAVHNHKSELREAARRAQKDQPNQPEEKVVVLPRYVRVNLLKTSVGKVTKEFQKEGYALLTADQAYCRLKCLLELNRGESGVSPSPPSPATGEVTVNSVTSFARAACVQGYSVGTPDLDSSAKVQTETEQKWFSVDPHVSELLVFSPATNLTKHRLYQTTQIVLQDKASCLPAHILSPPPGSTVIDACAAPGNKTTHLASIMGNQGCIYAFDKSRQRFSVLQDMVIKAGASCVQPIHMDFLKVCPEDYPTVQFILVDPSCSGSGISGRVDFDPQGLGDVIRLNQLAKFQKLVLKHALSFPAVERVVYSTCSVSKKENEGVVESALSEYGAKFDLVEVLPMWENRGLPVFREAAKCIRASPDSDLTNGFFVAMFQRRNTAST